MGDLRCPKCGNNSFQVRGDERRALTYICVACWLEMRLEDMTREFTKQEPKEKALPKIAG
jgi:DNA-directed RNA polymerase subunit RPC12/RpoP